MTTLPRWASNSLQLSGNAYADCGNPPILNGIQSYTLEAWVNLTTISGFQSVIGKINNGVDAAYQLFIQDGQVYSYYPTAPFVIMSPQQLTVNSWHHLATTYDSSSGTLTLYVDGVQVAQGNFPYTASTSAADALIGATLVNGTLDWFLQGMVGEVMIWNVCRSAEDVLNDSVQISYQGDTAVPALLMDMDFSSLPAADWAGNNIQVTLQQGANYCMCVPGLNLQSNAYADCGNNQDLSLGGGPYTIEGWFYPTDGTSGTIVSKFNANVAGEYAIGYENNRIYVSQYNMPAPITSAPYITPDAYYHFATTYDAHTTLLSLYINGNLQASQYVSLMPSAPSVDLLIGAMFNNGTPSGFFQGYIQNIRIWSTCLGQDQVRQWMYNQPEIEPNLVASFDFTVTPPTDSTGQHTIQLLNGAAVGFQMLPINPATTDANLGYVQSINAEYFSEYDVPPSPPPAVTPAAAPDRQFAPLTDEFKTAIWEDFAAGSLGDADDRTKENTRARFEEAYAEASELMRQNPDLLKVFTVREENGMLSVIHHGVKGDTLVFRAPSDAVDACTLWWIQFVFMLTIGFYQALGLLPSFGNIATRVYNMLAANPTVVAAFNTVVGKSITVTGAVTVVGVIYAEGYMWTILKMAFTSAGWWTLAWILKKVIAFVTGLQAAEVLAGFIVWASQLTVLSLNFHSSCGSTSLEPGEALPTALTA
jgi:hypothetical protein